MNRTHAPHLLELDLSEEVYKKAFAQIVAVDLVMVLLKKLQDQYLDRDVLYTVARIAQIEIVDVYQYQEAHHP